MEKLLRPGLDLIRVETRNCESHIGVYTNTMHATRLDCPHDFPLLSPDGIKLAIVARTGPIRSPAHMNNATTPNTTK